MWSIFTKLFHATCHYCERISSSWNKLIWHSDLRRRAASRLALPCPSSYFWRILTCVIIIYLHYKRTDRQTDNLKWLNRDINVYNTVIMKPWRHLCVLLTDVQSVSAAVVALVRLTGVLSSLTSPRSFLFNKSLVTILTPCYVTIDPYTLFICNNKKVQQSWQTSALAMHLLVARLVSIRVIFCLLPSFSIVILVFRPPGTTVPDGLMFYPWCF